MATAGKAGAVYVQTADASVAFTNEATTGDAGHLRYTINTAAKRYWDINTPVTVKVDGSTVTSGYTIEYPGGVVVFAASQGASVITVSGKYFAVAQTSGVIDWKLDVQTKDLDTTAMGDTWESCIVSVFGFSGSASAYWGDVTFFNRLGQIVVLVLYTDNGTAKDRFEGYAMFTGDGIETPFDDVVKESIDFKGVGQIYRRAG